MPSTSELEIQLASTNAQLESVNASIDLAVNARAELNDQLNKINNSRVDLERQIAAANAITALSLESQRRDLLSQALTIQTQLITARESVSALSAQQSQLEQQVESINRSIAAQDIESPIKTTDSVNISATDLETDAKYADPANFASNITNSENAFSAGTSSTAGILSEDPTGTTVLANTGIWKSLISNRATSQTAETPKITPAVPTISGKTDKRVRILVPASYLVNQTAGPNNEIKNNGGIVFPYTPDISCEHSATYTTLGVAHSNYAQQFYKNSAVSDITISGKFSVQNEIDAGIYLGTIHLLRALTKMKTGDDENAGSPPPVCRLMAYGPYMYDKTPVVIKSVRIQLPPDVDYITTGNAAKLYGDTSAPTMSTISVVLTPIYSRSEMLRSTVSGWLTKNNRSEGFL